MPRSAEYEGRLLTICCLELADGSCPVGEFLDRLDPKDRRKLDALFSWLGEHGKIPNVEKFKKLSGTNLFEFKSFQIRILCCFVPGKVVLLLHAVIKKKDKHSKTDIERAEMLRAQYLQQLTGNRK